VGAQWGEFLDELMERGTITSLSVLLYHSEMFERVVAACARSPIPLEELRISMQEGCYERVSIDALRELLELPATRRLERLSLNALDKKFAGRVDDEMARVIEAAPCATTLRRLELRNQLVTEQGVPALAGLPALEALDLSGNDFDPESLEVHGVSEHMHFALEGCVPLSERTDGYDDDRMMVLAAPAAFFIILPDEIWSEEFAQYVLMSAAIALFHAGLIAALTLLGTTHPLPFWWPLVCAPVGMSIRGTVLGPLMFSWLYWVDQSREHEADLLPRSRRLEQLSGIGYVLGLVSMHVLLFILAIYLCIFRGWAAPETLWLEVVLWAPEPWSLVALVVLIARGATRLRERFSERAPTREAPPR